jgi:GH24 family phage-related lysozyme (muramidase)
MQKLVSESLKERISFLKGIEGVREGPLRKEERNDGWWVMGEGHLVSANDEEDADRIIKNIKNT